MSYELLLLIALFILARAARATAAPRRPEHPAPMSGPVAQSPVANAELIPAALAKRNLGPLRIPSEAVLRARRGVLSRARVIPLGAATHLRGAVRLLIIVGPPRAVSPSPLDPAARSDAAKWNVQ
jgi:hypothetical protein